MYSTKIILRKLNLISFCYMHPLTQLFINQFLNERQYLKADQDTWDKEKCIIKV